MSNNKGMLKIQYFLDLAFGYGTKYTHTLSNNKGMLKIQYFLDLAFGYGTKYTHT
jgi:hypothetical protein